MRNIEKLFLNPMPSSRSGAFYNTFPYPTKISPETIAVYIASATQPGDTVLDAFAGSGSVGIAALLAERPTEKMIELAKTLEVTPVWGKRNAVLYEIGTYAAFATKTLTNQLSGAEYARVVEEFIRKGERLVGGMYEAKDPDGEMGRIRYAIWSEILLCPECGGEVEYFRNGTTRNPVTFRDHISCPHCRKTTRVDEMGFATEEHFDKPLRKTISRKKRKMAWVYGTTEGKNWDRAATRDDEDAMQRIEDNFSRGDAPKEIVWGDLRRAGYHYGITHLHHFYTVRNYEVMSKLWELAETYPRRESDALKLLLLSYNAAHCTLMTRVVAKRNAKDYVLTGAQSGVLYVSKLPVEKNILFGLRRKAKPFEEAYTMLENCHGEVIVRNQSSNRMAEPDKSIDFTFTDPPFGDFIPYAEVNQINELWLSSVTERGDEIIISNAQGKSVERYRDMLTEVFAEIKRVSKDGAPIAVAFHAAKASVWAAFSDAVRAAGLEIRQANFLDKTQASFKQIVSPSAVQGDPLFLLAKSAHVKSETRSDTEILEQVILTNPHETEIQRRHCYSLYIGKCMENGVEIKMDASQVYDYISERF